MNPNKHRLYRPEGNPFLDEMQPLAFWRSESGCLEDFPGREVRAYTVYEIEAYFKTRGLSVDDIQLYR